jgi:hypothetical protein
MNNWHDTILTQYLKDPITISLIESWNDAIDPHEFYDLFYDQVWNLDTCGTYGLDLWGRILGVGRVLNISANKYFGFDEATTLSADPFNQSPFYSGAPLTGNYALSNDGFRVLLNAKALANISNSSCYNINQILMTLFAGRGNAYVIDNQDQSMTYAFNFVLTAVEVAIVQQSGVLPKTVGCKITYVQNG